MCIFFSWKPTCIKISMHKIHFIKTRNAHFLLGLQSCCLLIPSSLCKHTSNSWYKKTENTHILIQVSYVHTPPPIQTSWKANKHTRGPPPLPHSPKIPWRHFTRVQSGTSSWPYSFCCPTMSILIPRQSMTGHSTERPG